MIILERGIDIVGARSIVLVDLESLEVSLNNENFPLIGIFRIGRYKLDQEIDWQCMDNTRPRVQEKENENLHTEVLFA